jgi:hypothetical protein
MMLAAYVTQNFNNNTLTATVSLDTEKALDTTQHFDQLYKLSELQFSTSLIRLIPSFLTVRKCKVLVEGKFLCQEK